MAVVEAATITGPAKNLLDFFASAGAPAPEWQQGSQSGVSVPNGEAAQIGLSLVTYHRSQAPVPPDEAPNEFVVRSRAAGVPVDVIGERYPFDPRVLAGLRGVANRRTPHIIETHHVKSHFLMRLSGAWRRRPWIAWHHGYTQTDTKVRLYNYLDRWSLRAARRVITVNQVFARELAAIGVAPGRIRVLHNSIVPDWLTPERAGDPAALRRSLGIAPDEPVILAVGRFSREKALDDLVRAFIILRKDNPARAARLVLVGDGPERATIEQLATESGVAGQVHFIGQVSDPAPYYALANVLALPSLSEGSPLALLEAMGAGRAIVATQVGGIPEMVTDGQSALLVPSQQPEALAKALGRVLDDKTLAARLSSGAREAAQRFTPAAHREARLKIYRELLAESSRI